MEDDNCTLNANQSTELLSSFRELCGEVKNISRDVSVSVAVAKATQDRVWDHIKTLENRQNNAEEKLTCAINQMVQYKIDTDKKIDSCSIDNDVKIDKYRKDRVAFMSILATIVVFG